ncbi:PstS family phosphate ABC transporter substrate-binding protein [Paenibacillus gansuensis]|uniref:Phosphate-binding protein n=1 Tax=Paenibacillus gansuensis TaxID=306542 RepID=A0ABW5PEK5_9BACL
MFTNVLRKGSIVLASTVLAFTLAACGNNGGSNTAGGNTAAGGNNTGTEQAADLKGEIRIDGSSTVFPITQAVAEEFMAVNNGVNVTVGEGGTSTGFKKIINGEIDIADASRHVKDEEVADLKAKNQEVVEMPIALDGITVVVNKENTWAKEITVDELKKIWQKDSTVKLWSDVRADWPKEPIKLYGPGTSSGTFEYFTEEINGKKNESRTDYTPSEDDNVLVTGVAGDKNAMGYFGFAYYEENQEKLTAVSIKADANAPAVAPSVDTIRDGSYKPLSRPIFIYPLKSALAKPEIAAFLKYYNSEEGQTLVEEVGYIKLPAEDYQKNLDQLK